MSRTYRRKNCHKEVWWTYAPWSVKIEGVVPRLEGKELEKAIARFHSDGDMGWTASKEWRQSCHQEFRAKAKEELLRWKRNLDHEVQIRNNPRWPWWD